jgi:hypothetical protein
MVQQKRARDNRRHPGLAHRTIRCATGQCLVHQGTRRPTLHLQEFSEGSAIIYQTVRCNTGLCPVLQRRATLNSPASGIRSAIIHRTCPVHTGLYGEPAEQQLLRANGRLQRIKCTPARRGAVHSPVAHRTYRTCSVRHRTARQAHTSELQRSEPNGLVTWLAHRTVSGGAPDCPVRHATAASTKRLVWWLGL